MELRREGNGKHEARGNKRISDLGYAMIFCFCRVVWKVDGRQERGRGWREEKKQTGKEFHILLPYMEMLLAQ